MKIAVLGVGHTQFGELWDKNIFDLIAQAQKMALDDARLTPQALQQIVVGNMCSGMLSGQQHLGTFAASMFGLSIPAFSVEGACASGSLALHAAIAALESGRAEVVMVTGVEKLMDNSIEQVTGAFMGASNRELEHFVGATFPGIFALVVRAYQHKFNIPREHIAAVSIKNHKNGKQNPLAHLRKEITLSDVLNASMVADPIGLLECAPISDGAASVILATADYAARHGYTPVHLIGSGLAVDVPNIADRPTLYSFAATRKAAALAYAQADITPDDIDVAEVHDAFSLAEIIALEDLGFFEQGKAARVTVDGITSLQGVLPINPSGGLKSRGHPVGATGIAQVVEIVNQLRGVCGVRQVQGASLGLTHNMGGVGATVAVNIFSNKA